MKPEEFTKWLRELLLFSPLESLNESQTALIKAKLETVFKKVTPSVIPNPQVDYKNIAQTC